MSENLSIKLPLVGEEILSNSYKNLAVYRNAVLEALSYAESLEGLELTPKHKLALYDLLDALFKAQDKEFEDLSKSTEAVDY